MFIQIRITKQIWITKAADDIASLHNKHGAVNKLKP